MSNLVSPMTEEMAGPLYGMAFRAGSEPSGPYSPQSSMRVCSITGRLTATSSGGGASGQRPGVGLIKRVSDLGQIIIGADEAAPSCLAKLYHRMSVTLARQAVVRCATHGEHACGGRCCSIDRADLPRPAGPTALG
jgi:hypothetical protein